MRRDKTPSFASTMGHDMTLSFAAAMERDMIMYDVRRLAIARDHVMSKDDHSLICYDVMNIRLPFWFNVIPFFTLSTLDGVFWQQIMVTIMDMKHPNNDISPIVYIITFGLSLALFLLTTILSGVTAFDDILKRLNIISAPTLNLKETKVPVGFSAIATCLLLFIVGIFCWLLVDVDKVVKQQKDNICSVILYVIANSLGFNIFLVMACFFGITLIAGIVQGSSKAAVTPVSDHEMPVEPNS
ncbi:Uncharacterized protein TCM_031243 [Theobroma cacao]|uniref:Uncharacterized protein n=1 Tax=Theobroma cacao TaxID=3641 RepID=A0A061F776_THECC|nr:Uncharacterized protein TCM_031243 [Theobroma cacao]